MKNPIRYLSFMFMALLLLVQVPTADAAPTAAPIIGEIERLTVNEPNNVYSGGVMVVGGVEVILPKNLLIDLPANRLTLQQIFAQAPAACLANGESGLAKTDKCIFGGTGGFATLTAVNTNAGNVIAGDVLIDKGTESLMGKISYIDYAQGFFRVNGDANNADTGVMVRLNDPTSRHTVQSGAGCAGGPNCSPDPRFTLDPDNYTNTFATGYPLCIPSSVSRSFPGLPGIPGVAAIPAQSTAAGAGGSGDLLCPSTNRTPAQVLEPPVADSRRFAPIVVGDSITAEGNFETINGTRFLSAHTTQVGKALETKSDPNQPDYLFLAEVFIEAPAFQNQRQRAMWIGFTTLAPTDVDMWSIHRDPVNNAIHEFPLASVRGCDNASGAGTCSNQGLLNAGANIFRIRYDVDFLMAQDPRFPGGTKDGKLSPCDHLRANNAQTPNRFAALNICGSGINLTNQFGILSPIPHEIQTRTGHLLDNPDLAGKTIDVLGNVATNGQYLYPLGMNLGGIEVAEMNEIDLNALATPVVAEGIPWNLDRRLGPGGCLNGGCENDALGTYALDPFPFSGLDPRTQTQGGGGAGGLPVSSYSDPNFTASTLASARDRIFSYVSGSNFDGNNTLLPYALGSFPADPALITINPTPVLNIFPPIAVEDFADARGGIPVVIDVLANDVPILGTIDAASVQIATAPGSGSIQVNQTTGAITYTPVLAASGTINFSYTVANNFGAVSAPGNVAVTILAPAVPTGTMTINGGAAFTNSATVTLTLSATSVNGPVTQMQFSKDGVNFFPFEPYATTRVVTLLPGDGPKTMYVRFADAAGKVSAIISAPISLDTGLPAGTMVMNGGALFASSSIVNLTLSATDANGVASMQFSNDGINFFTPVPYATSYSVNLLPGDGVRTLLARFIDAAGNVSAAVSASITVSSVPATGGVVINGGAAFTGSAIANLLISATATNATVTEMQISKDGVNYFPFEPYATTRDVTLLPGDGVKNIYIRFKDSLGNISAPVSDSIILDTTKPTGTIAFTTPDPTTTATGTLALTADDANGVTQMQFSKNGGASYFAFEPFATSRTVTLAVGPNTLTVRFKDSAGNVSDPVSASITRN